MGDPMRVVRLSSTPVKGLAMHNPGFVDLTAGGVKGDRLFYLIDDAGGIVNCTAVGELLRYTADFNEDSGMLAVHGPDGLVRAAAIQEREELETSFYGLRSVSGHIIAGWDEVFSDIAGQSLRLVKGATGGFDVAGVTLLGAASVSELAVSNGADPVDPARFRMNIEISGSAPLAEDGWEGQDLQLGSAVVRVGGPVLRCATTTRDPRTGAVNLKTLAMIGTLKGRQETQQWGQGFYFGVYAEVVTPGRVSLGDAVDLL